MPSTGFEPVTFPMSRERATTAPTGLKTNKIFKFPVAISCDTYIIPNFPAKCKIKFKSTIYFAEYRTIVVLPALVINGTIKTSL